MRNRARFGTAAVAAALGLAVLAACSGPSAAPSGSAEPSSAAPAAEPTQLVVGTSLDNPTWDPAQVGSPENTNIYMPTVYETLMRKDPDGKLIPGVATEWEYSEGNTVLTMKLRQGVTFSDGEALDAEAVKLNFERVREVSTNLSIVENVVVVDPGTIRFELEAANPTLLDILSTKPSMASPKAIEDPETLALKPVGSGPYVMDEAASTAGVEYRFVRNEGYWDAASYPFDVVILRPLEDITARLNALKSGQVDVTALDSQSAVSINEAEAKVYARPATWQALVLADRAGELLKPLGDVRVRQAINYALDKDGMAKALAGGYATPSSQITGASSPMHNPELDGAYAYDPAKAKALLAEAGYADGFDLTLPSFDFTSSYDVVVKQALEDIGIRVTLETMPGDRFGELIEGEWPAFTMSDEFDNVWPNELRPVGVWNPRHTETPELSGLMEKAASSESEADRTAASKAIGKYLVEQAWFAPYFQPQTIYAARTGVEITTVIGQSAPQLSHFVPAAG